MRSFAFLLMLTVCLVATECATSNEEVSTALQTEQQLVDARSVVTTKAAEKAPAPEGEPEGDEDPEADHTAPQPLPPPPVKDSTGDPQPENPPTQQKPPPPPPPQQPQQHQPPQQQQQQQQLLSQRGTSHGTEDSQKELGGTKQSGHHAAPIVRSEEEARTGHAVNPERSEGGDTNQHKPHEPSQPLKEQPPPSSHSTVGSEQKPSTSITTTENGTGKDITPPGTATTQGEKDNVPAEKPATPISSPSHNAATDTNITTGEKKTDSTQTSVPSTTESEKVESTVPTTPLKKLSKALQSYNKKDGTIGSPSLCAFTALVTLVIMAVAPVY